MGSGGKTKQDVIVDPAKKKPQPLGTSGPTLAQLPPFLAAWATQTYSQATVFGDPATQSIGPQYAADLSSRSLRDEIGYVMGLLDTAALGSAEHQSLEGNLAVLVEEADERGVDVPVLVTRALEEAARLWSSDMGRLAGELSTIARTKLGRGYDPFLEFFPGTISWGIDQVSWMVDAMGGAVTLARVAQWLPDSISAPMYRAAGTQYMAALMGSQLFHVWLAYLHVGVAALQAYPSIDMEFLLRSYINLEKELQPILDDLKSLDESRVNSASARVAKQLPGLRDDFEKWVDVIKSSLADAQKVLKAIAIAEIAFALIGAVYAYEGGGGPSIFMGAPGISGVTSTGSATMQIVVSAEWIAAIEKLIEAGAIAAPAIANLSAVIGMGGAQLGPLGTAPGMMSVQTPSGSVTPSTGADSGKNVSYGDTRNKHTRVGDRPVQELKDAMANPGTGTPELQDMQRNQGKGTYGSQLGKEAVDKYGDLVKDALENGTRLPNGGIDHTATFEVGVDIFSGQGTKNYRMYFSQNYGGWHIFPMP